MKMRAAPAVRTLPPYYDHPAYIDALAVSIEQHLAALDFEPEIVLASYHGIPKAYFEKGDPYHCHCMKTTRLLRERLGWSKEKLITTFQSRFGRATWLEPATDTKLESFGKAGQSVAIFAPGFSADCLETLEELAIRGKEQFEATGGRRFTYLPCLNAEAPGMAMIETLVRRELAGWL